MSNFGDISAFTVFLLSGAAALLYQVIWQRMLVFFTGADVYSSTIIVAAFMAGLGVGNLAGGALADRTSPRRSLLLFAVAELAIAGFSVMSRHLYYDLLYQQLGPLGIPPAALVALLFVSLLWPTFFMGMSLPLLARAFTATLDRAPAVIGALYGCNTLGAALGAFAATWWILPAYGLEPSLWIGAAVNVLCAAAMIVFAAFVPRTGSGPILWFGDRLAPSADGAVHVDLERHRFWQWAVIYALSGFLALSLELVWFRLLGVVVKSTAFTFGTLLAIYLTGLGAGSLAGIRYAPRLTSPATVFLMLQTAVGLSAALILAGSVGAFDDITWFRRYFASYEPLDVRESVAQLRALMNLGAGGAGFPWQFLLLYFALPGFLIIPPTFLMGLSFPVLQRVAQTDLARLGRRVGILMVANIVGSVAGTIVTGWLALNLLGAAGTMKALAITSGVFAALGLRLSSERSLRAGRLRVSLRVAAGAAAGLLGVAVVATPDAATLWARLHGTTTDRIIFGEDATGLSLLRLEPTVQQGQTTVFVNGLGQSTVPYGDIHTALGMLPAFIHPYPREVAIIGLGSGDTLYGAAARLEIQQITCIEIIGPQLDTLRQLTTRHPYGGLLGLLDPRIRHVAADGRQVLMRSPPRFDIIEADALRPNSAYSGNLFSDGYFRLLRTRLRPGGLAVTWSPTPRVQNAFVTVFPHVLSFPGMLLGSAEPIAFDRNVVLQRLAAPHVREHYARAGIDVQRIVASFLVEPRRYTPDFERSTLVNFNTDLFPRDEFDLSPPPR